jgi:outer membrane murein-binding lipoprotein Lpp
VREGALIGPIIVAIGLVVAAVSFAVVGALLETADGATELRLDRAEGDIRDLHREIDALNSELEQARDDIRRLTEDIALRPAAPAAPPASQAEAPPTVTIDGQIVSQDVTDGSAGEQPPPTEAMTEVMTLADSRFNIGITQPRSSIMIDILGHPRPAQDYSTDCQSVTNPALRELLETRQIGPIRVTMIRPALDSLERIVGQLREQEPDIYEALGTAGALCVRLVRGSTRSISNHSWATAIDLKLEGRLDSFGDGGTQFGLLLLAELFNEEGWYWGATYSREDSMHFEVGVETLRRWRSEGLI